jgi:hypothetical protein
MLLQGALRLAFLTFLTCFGVQSAAVSDELTNRIKIEYGPPANAQDQAVRDLLTRQQALEKLQLIFAPFRLPLDLTIKTASCNGEANAWYERPQKKPAVTICYEYIEEIKIPSGAMPSGVTSADAVTGQFFYVAAHELGHAIFDLLDIPIFGNLEDAADQFATYIMLQFGKEQARRLIVGAAYSYRDDVQKNETTVSLRKFASSHSPPQVRFFNLICLAYGADQQLFADVVEKGYLPESRAKRCKREFREIAFAFKQLIRSHVDFQMAKSVLESDWLPDTQRELHPQ